VPEEQNQTSNNLSSLAKTECAEVAGTPVNCNQISFSTVYPALHTLLPNSRSTDNDGQDTHIDRHFLIARSD
jgi:hypothetical protein